MSLRKNPKQPNYEAKMSQPTQSIMMEKLYGPEIAKIVYQRCQELGEDFNQRVQRYVYDTIWARAGLALEEKSLITIIALISNNKAEQLKVHLWGFFHQGGTSKDIIDLLDYLKKQEHILDENASLSILKQAEKNYLNFTNKALLPGTSLDLKGRGKNIIDFASHIAIGNNEKTKICMKALLENKQLTIEEMQNIMQHVAVYCGFPVEMNGLAVMHDILHLKE